MKGLLIRIGNTLSLKTWDMMAKITSRIQPSSKYYILKYKKLKKQGKNTDAFKLLKRGTFYYTQDYDLNRTIAIHYMKKGNWKRSLYYWKRISIHDLALKKEDFQKYVIVLKRLRKYECMEDLLNIEMIPKNYFNVVLEALFTYYLSILEWNKAKYYYQLLKESTVNIKRKTKIKRAMLYQFQGEFSKAKNLYNTAFGKKTNRYTKITLFNNGESKIEFYKRHSNTKDVICTFDSINITWNNRPFGYRFLKKQNLDIIALRRRRADSYHQDITAKEYSQVLNKIIKFYNRKIAYGFSLGGYTSLYYGSAIDAKVLSISPRNSTHPIYGVDPFEKEVYRHEIHHEKNERIQPIILYDPKNSIDTRYVEQELLFTYPKAKLIKLPFAGHRIAPHLSLIGALKDIVQSVIDNREFPDLRLYNKRKSDQYLSILSEVCFNRHKYKWAKSISKKALSINPENIRSIKILIKTLLIEKKFEEALSFLRYQTELKNEDNWFYYVEFIIEQRLENTQFRNTEEVEFLIQNIIN